MVRIVSRYYWLLWTWALASCIRAQLQWCSCTLAIIKVHDEINQFLMEFIDHSNTTADYVLRDRSFLESVLDIDFKDTTQTGNFARLLFRL